MFSVTYKLEPAHEATAARDLTRKLAEGNGRQRGGVGDGRAQQVQGWHHADGYQSRREASVEEGTAPLL